MIKSMTGFASREARVRPFGKVSVELRSTNHKFQEIVLHLPEGFLSLEDRIKKIIEQKIKRGRVTCAISIVGCKIPQVCVNKSILKEYAKVIGGIQRQLHLADRYSVDTLINLPGVLSLTEKTPSKSSLWPVIKKLAEKASGDLFNSRKKEGAALQHVLSTIVGDLEEEIKVIKTRFRAAAKERLSRIETDEERANFLKDTDITEELDRLKYHARNFRRKLFKNTPVGKELDFIAQEMQREANTMAAKSFDTAVSARVVAVKSQIEKVREQVQNIE